MTPADAPRSRKYVARVAAALVAAVALASVAVTERASLAASLALLAHLAWIWIPAAIVLESASMIALSGMQRRLLAAGGASVRARPMLATTFAANALSVSMPLVGPELGTVFTFRRFTRQGADAPLASSLATHAPGPDANANVRSGYFKSLFPNGQWFNASDRGHLAAAFVVISPNMLWLFCRDDRGHPAERRAARNRWPGPYPRES